MKALTYVFYAAVAGIAACLAMTIVTAVHQHREKVAAETAPLTLPLPAEANHAAPAAPAAPTAPTAPAKH